MCLDKRSWPKQKIAPAGTETKGEEGREGQLDVEHFRSLQTHLPPREQLRWPSSKQRSAPETRFLPRWAIQFPEVCRESERARKSDELDQKGKQKYGGRDSLDQSSFGHNESKSSSSSLTVVFGEVLVGTSISLRTIVLILLSSRSVSSERRNDGSVSKGESRGELERGREGSSIHLGRGWRVLESGLGGWRVVVWCESTKRGLEG